MCLDDKEVNQVFNRMMLDGIRQCAHLTYKFTDGQDNILDSRLRLIFWKSGR